MNYELAKKLKENGFPQRARDVMVNPNTKEIEELTNPTFSELIEACGQDFYFLMRHTKSDKSNDWCASSNKKLGDNYYGQTPEEAVSNLWLALNKKSST